MKTRMSFLIVFMALVMAVASFAQSGRGANNGRTGNGQHDNRGGAGLTDEQKQELHDLISSMREAEATRDEIRQAVDALFVEWGIERPDRDGRGGSNGNLPALTDEQKAELKALRESMTADGATREEIRAAVEALFADWGIEMPNWNKGRRGHAGFNDPQLTDEQREILQAKIAELREAEATREEIHEAIEALYAEWGLEMPERDGRWGDLLTEEQQAELKALVQEMKDADATREEIRAAVDALFEEWGIERPDFDGRKGKGKKGKSWMGDLTEEQRATIREMIQQMKADGATREEIRDAVKAQLEEWGIGGEGDPEGAQNLRARKNIQATNAPNPFNPTTTITYALEEAGPVSVKVYNTQGRLIRTLVDADVSQGQHSVVWNGLNDKGEQVSSGMYFYKVTTATETTTERMMLMK
jgi:ribosomal protein L23